MGDTAYTWSTKAEWKQISQVGRGLSVTCAHPECQFPFLCEDCWAMAEVLVYAELHSGGSP